MDAIDQARSLVPWWVLWGPVLLLPAVFPLCCLAAWLGTVLALVPFRRYAGEFWVEQARLAWPARIVANTNVILLGALGAVLTLPGSGPLGLVPGPVRIGLGALAGLLAGYLVAHQLRCRLGIATGNLGQRFRGTLSFLLIAYPQLPVLLLLLVLMPIEWHWRAPLILLTGVLLLLWLLLGGGLQLARLLDSVWPASDRLTALVERTVERVGTRPRAAYLAELGFTNAFALPPTRSLLISRSLLDHLTDDEMIAILAHELAHLGESRLVTWLRISSIFLFLPLGATGLLITAFDLYGVTALLLIIFVAMHFLLRLTRRMEEEADRVGQAHEVAAGDYARALERLHQLEWIPVVLPGKQQTHPHLYDRLLAAGVEPPYPRPAPPSRWWSTAGTMASLLLLLTCSGLLYLGPFLFLDRSIESAILARLALTGGDGHALSELALYHYQRSEFDQAISLYRAASAVEADSPHYAGNLAIVLAYLNRCDEADDALREAIERQGRLPRLPAGNIISMAQEEVRQCRERREDSPRRED